MRKYFSYQGLPFRLRDWPAFLLLGLARHGLFDHYEPLGRWARRKFPTLTLRPRQLKGMRVRVDPFDSSQLDVFDEVFLLNSYELSKVPFTPDLIIDCGSHIGLFTARAAKHFPGVKIVSFEPVPQNAAEVDWVVQRNGISAEVRREAVGCQNDVTTFYTRCSCGGSLRSDVGGELDAFPVNVVDLRELLARWAPTKLLLKVDIEGEEERLIPHLIEHLPSECTLFFETHTGSEGWNLVASTLNDHQFQVELLRRRDPYRDGVAVRAA